MRVTVDEDCTVVGRRGRDQAVDSSDSRSCGATQIHRKLDYRVVQRCNLTHGCLKVCHGLPRKGIGANAVQDGRVHLEKRKNGDSYFDVCVINEGINTVRAWFAEYVGQNCRTV